MIKDDRRDSNFTKIPSYFKQDQNKLVHDKGQSVLNIEALNQRTPVFKVANIDEKRRHKSDMQAFDQKSAFILDFVRKTIEDVQKTTEKVDRNKLLFNEKYINKEKQA